MTQSGEKTRTYRMHKLKGEGIQGKAEKHMRLEIQMNVPYW